MLRGITAADLSRFLDQSLTLERLAWLRRVRTWARTRHAENPTRCYHFVDTKRHRQYDLNVALLVIRTT